MDIFVSLPAQSLELYEGKRRLARYPISSALRGAGEEAESFMTPRGRHLIRAKIGRACPENTVFVRRRPTGELWTPELAAAFPDRDWILTRILWLSGKEPGRNRLGRVDTMRRFIYIHGTPDQVKLGEPGSRGCLRMRNADIVALFERVPAYIAVNIGDFRLMSERGDGPFEIQAADSEGRQIGLCLADSEGRVGEIEVVDAWRGQGVARQMLRAMAELIDRSGLELALPPKRG